MTELLFQRDAYQTEATARVTGLTAEGGIVLDSSLFYATSGGQPGDSGALVWDDGTLLIATAVKAHDAGIALVPAEPSRLPPVGTSVIQKIDWERRYRHMRLHTALHLLSVVIPLPVTGGAIGTEKARLDFDMPDTPGNKAVLEQELNELIARDLEVRETWISDAELKVKPDLIKTLSVKPPIGTGRIRLIGIGRDHDQVDLQPCGGTHVARTGEVGLVTIGKIEKKGRQNRRVTIHLET